MLHGGIRYLENFQIKLVREALKERAWWLKNAGQYTKSKRFFVPVYKNRSRSRLRLYMGVKFYEWLAGKESLGRSRIHGIKETLSLNPTLSPDGLLGSVSYLDVQMDDYGLSEWLVKKAKNLGVIIESYKSIKRVGTDGLITMENGKTIRYLKVVNACGPWAKRLLDDSNIDSAYSLDLVKGSHLFIDRVIENPLVIQLPNEDRIIFALPHEDKTLIGTTESRHSINDQITCRDWEVDYLISAINSVFFNKIERREVLSTFAGVRPIVQKEQGEKCLSKASRESAVEIIGNLINVYGGKWTSAMSLGKSVANKI